MHLAAIALTYGVDPDDIWNHPDNAKLKSLRQSGNVLAPLDVLSIPVARRQWSTVSPGTTARFVARLPGVRLKLKLHDELGPFSREAFVLESSRGQVAGTTGSDGSIDVTVSVHDRAVQLRVPGRRYVTTLLVGGLDPVESSSGLQTRLYHLGFLPRPATGREDALTRDAVRAFQRAQGLPDTGVVDTKTAEAIRTKYGC
jgi:hypothetical protein